VDAVQNLPDFKLELELLQRDLEMRADSHVVSARAREDLT